MASIQVFTSTPAELIYLLEARLPRSMTLLRRLQFASFPSGTTDSARIIVASDVPLQKGDRNNFDSLPSIIRHFTATYLDLSHGLETNIWLYSTFEDSQDVLPNASTPSSDDDTLQRRQIMTVLNEARHQARIYPVQPLAYPGHIFIGSLHNAVRKVALESGLCLISNPEYEYEKFIFRIDELPLSEPLDIHAGMKWATGTMQDFELVASRTKIPRSVLVSWTR